MMKNKIIKFGGCITTIMLVFGTLLFGFISGLGIYSFFDNGYDWTVLVGGTICFVFFVLNLHKLLPYKYSKRIIFAISVAWCVTLMVREFL